MSDNRGVAKALIVEAADTIINRRPGVHGSAENSFKMIGEMWTAYLNHVFAVRGIQYIRPEDVAQMMVILKQCRAVYGDRENRDNFVDALGYIALAGMLQLPEQGSPEKEEDNREGGNEVKMKHTNIDTRSTKSRLPKAGTWDPDAVQEQIAADLAGNGNNA